MRSILTSPVCSRWSGDISYLHVRVLRIDRGYSTLGWLIFPLTGHLTVSQIQFQREHNCSTVLPVSLAAQIFKNQINQDSLVLKASILPVRNMLRLRFALYFVFQFQWKLLLISLQGMTRILSAAGLCKCKEIIFGIYSHGVPQF